MSHLLPFSNVYTCHFILKAYQNRPKNTSEASANVQKKKLLPPSNLTRSYYSRYANLEGI